MWDPIVSVPDHCLSFYFAARFVIGDYRITNSPSQMIVDI